jgi:hypothetical protein
VTQPESPVLPSWITKRDGRLVPFEPDKISQALFAVTEELQQPDAFLARELADSVLHFLPAEVEGGVPTTLQIAELVIKVVRELAHPALAGAYADYALRRAELPTNFRIRKLNARQWVTVRFNTEDDLSETLQECTQAYTLQAVFTRDLVAAHNEGLIILWELEAPLHLGGLAPDFSLQRPGSLLERLLEVRQNVGGVVALDGPEYLLTPEQENAESSITDFVRELRLGVRATGLDTVINLNVPSPPTWAKELASGPLFAARPGLPDANQRSELAFALLEAIVPVEGARVDWHLSEQDFTKGSEACLERVAARATDLIMTFVFDRSKRPLALAEGIDRQHPALLAAVSLSLARLAALPGVAGNFDLFLRKLGSLARMAISAGVQKRDFLRRHLGTQSDMARGFVLDRARLRVIPLGLEVVARGFAGQDAGEERVRSLARTVIQHLTEVLRIEGTKYLLDTCIDGLPELVEGTKERSGLTPWNATATVKNRLKSAAALHVEAGGGTAVVLVPKEREPTTAIVISDWLRWAWEQTGIRRLIFRRDE